MAHCTPTCIISGNNKDVHGWNVFEYESAWLEAKAKTTSKATLGFFRS